MLGTLSNTILRDSVLRIPCELLPDSMLSHFEVENKAAAHQRTAPPTLSYIHRMGDEYWLPRNYPIRSLLPYARLEDRTVVGAPIAPPRLDITFHAFQLSGINHVVWNPGDQILCSPCGSGKTTMGLGLIERIPVKTLILTQTEQLLDQWRRRMQKFMDYDPGLIKGKKRDVRDITLAMVQTLSGKPPEEYPELQDVGHVITDECHGIAAMEWQKALWPLPAARRTGLTATPRDDGLEPVMVYGTGEISYRISHQELVDAGIILVPEVVHLSHRSTAYLKTKRGGELDLVKTKTEMALDAGRNDVLADVIRKCLLAGRKILVIVERHAHVERLVELVEAAWGPVDYGFLRGGMKPWEYEEAYEKPLIFGQLQIVKQGLDLPELDTAIFGSPFSSHGLVEQVLGRVSRVAPNKKTPLVVDLTDTGNIMLIKMGAKRKQVYARLGCQSR